MPCCDVMLTIRPRASPTSGCVSIWRTAARHSRYGPRRLTAIIASQSVRLGVEQRLRVVARQHGVVDHQVERAGALDRRRDQPLAVGRRRRRRRRRGRRCRRRPRITSSVGSPPVIGSRRMSASEHVEPVVGQPDRDRPADPRCGARDDGAALRSFDLPSAVRILPACPASPSSPTACSTRTRRRTAAPAARASTRRWSRRSARAAGGSSRCPARSSPSPACNRFWAVKEQLDTAAYRRHCRRLAAAVAGAVEVHVRRGDDVILVGIEGSPSMGVHVTSSDPEPRRPAGVAGRRERAVAGQRHLHGGARRRAGRARRRGAAGDGHLPPAARPTTRPPSARALATLMEAAEWTPTPACFRVALVAGRAAEPGRGRGRRADGARAGGLGRDPAPRGRLPGRGRRAAARAGRRAGRGVRPARLPAGA